MQANDKRIKKAGIVLYSDRKLLLLTENCYRYK
jgi:hypothetical protein